jgi:hypothetical protein
LLFSICDFAILSQSGLVWFFSGQKLSDKVDIRDPPIHKAMTRPVLLSVPAAALAVALLAALAPGGSAVLSACPAAAAECPGPFRDKWCTNDGVKASGSTPPLAFRQAVYAAGVKLHGASAWGSVAAVPAGESWNKESGFAASDKRGCGTACTDVYTKVALAYSPKGGCWPKEKGVPVIANKDTTDAQMKTCLEVLTHQLMPRPKGTYLTTPTEVLDKVLENKVIFNCGNNPKKEGSKLLAPYDTFTATGYPNLEDGTEGGGGTYYAPDAYGEQTGMCPGQPGETNAILGDGYKASGTRYGGHVAVVGLCTLNSADPPPPRLIG